MIAALKNRRKRFNPQRFLHPLVSLMLGVLAVFGLSGCWSRQELNTLAIVLGTGLDLGSAPDTLEMTAQVVRAGKIKSDSSTSSDGGTSADKAYINIQNTDKSVLAIVRGVTNTVSRKCSFSQVTLRKPMFRRGWMLFYAIMKRA